MPHTSIPEALVVARRLTTAAAYWTAFAGMTALCGAALSPSLRAKRSNPSRSVNERMDCFVALLLAMTADLTRRLEPLFGQQPHRGIGVHRLAERKALGVFAAQLIELDRIRIGLGAFGDHVHAEVVGEC